MSNAHPALGRVGAGLVGVLLALSGSLSPVIVQGALNDVVLLRGENSDQASLNLEGFGTVSLTLSPQEACALTKDFLGQNLPPMSAGELGSALAEIGFALGGYEGADAAVQVPGALQDCADDPADGSGDFWLIYTTCSMIMGSGTYWMRWTVPPFTAEAEAIMLDMSSGTGIAVPLETRLNQVRDNASLALGNLRDYDISGPAGTKSYTLNVPEPQEFTAQGYEFSYEGDIGSPMGGMVPMQLGNITTTGQAWIVPDAPGADVIGVFYQNFRDNVVPSTGANSLLGGMMRQMAGLAGRGIPVDTTQTTTMQMMGLASVLGNAGAGQSRTSTSTINSITVVPSAAPANCAATVIPEGVEMTDLSALMAGAAAQAGAAGTGQGAAPGFEAMPDLSEAMNAVNAAMQDMTPEERAAMQQLSGGLGALLGGLAGAAGAVPGAAPPVALAPAPAPARSGPSSSELMTDDLTQSVQNMLQALGYDPGNTDGEVTIETTIAISQFQAEKGLAVTGEVSPQLAGILSAEVDR